nr:putative movement protein [Ailanthus crinkle leaf associated emaravirus]
MMRVNFWFKLFALALFSNAVPGSNGLTIEDPTVVDHDISNWGEANKNQELSEAVVDGLASTVMKRQIEVKPSTQIISFTFYNYVTEFLKKYVNGLKTVRIASILVHYKPHTDACTGTVSFALVDKRYTDKLDVKAKINENGVEKIKSQKNTIMGKIHQLVTVKCNMESIIQMSMNYFVTISDLKKIKLVQVVSGNNMVTGTLATINLGWKTVPGEATIYQPYHAQRYYIPRLKMPELVGKDDKYIYNSLVKMAKDRHDKEVQMLNQLQELIDGQMIINNDLDTDLKNQLDEVNSKIEKHQDDIQKLERVIPEKQKLIEAQRKLDELERIKKDKLIEYNKDSNLAEEKDDETISINGGLYYN